MLFTESKIYTADNSGGILVKCIKVPGSSKPRYARHGDQIIVSTRIVKPKLNIKLSRRVVKGGIYKAMVIRTKKPFFFFDGSFVKFDRNNVALVQKTQFKVFGPPKLAGSKIKGPVPYNKKLKKRFPKIYSTASFVYYYY